MSFSFAGSRNGGNLNMYSRSVELKDLGSKALFRFDLQIALLAARKRSLVRSCGFDPTGRIAFLPPRKRLIQTERQFPTLVEKAALRARLPLDHPSLRVQLGETLP